MVAWEKGKVLENTNQIKFKEKHKNKKNKKLRH
jgi:hypothetical protein